MANDELSNSQRIVRRAPITDIVVAYRSLQVEDLKRKKMRPGRKCEKEKDASRTKVWQR